MKLGTYLEQHSITYADFAARIGVSHARTVERYAKALRVPDGAIMKRIVEETDGMVMPNDFFELGDFTPSMAATGKTVRDDSETGKKSKTSPVDLPFRAQTVAEVRL